MSDFYCKSGAGAVQFQQSHAYVSGNLMVPVLTDAGTNIAVARKWVWECTTGGTSAAANPTWPASVTQDVTTVTSSGATFTARKPGFSTGTTANWAWAGIFLAWVMSATIANGDRVLVSHQHAESVGSANNITFTPGASSQSGPQQILCVNDGATPPTTLATTATVTNTNNVAPAFNGSDYFYGITWNMGTANGASGAGYQLTQTASAVQVFETCVFNMVGSNANSTWSFGGPSAQAAYIRWINVSISVGNASQALDIFTNNCKFEWDTGGGSSATKMTALFKSATGGRIADARLRGVDLSNLLSSSGNIFLVSTASHPCSIVLTHCKVPAAWSGAPTSGTLSGYPGEVTLLYYDAGSGTSNTTHWKKGYAGDVVTSTGVYRNGGLTDGSNPQSWKMTGSSNNNIASPLRSFEFSVWVDTTTAAQTINAYLAMDSASVPKDIQIYIEGWLETNSQPLGTYFTTSPNAMSSGSNLTTDSNANWTGIGGFANPNTYKISKTFTNGIKGWCYGRVCIGGALGTATYVDPPTKNTMS